MLGSWHILFASPVNSFFPGFLSWHCIFISLFTFLCLHLFSGFSHLDRKVRRPLRWIRWRISRQPMLFVPSTAQTLPSTSCISRVRILSASARCRATLPTQTTTARKTSLSSLLIVCPSSFSRLLLPFILLSRSFFALFCCSWACAYSLSFPVLSRLSPLLPLTVRSFGGLQAAQEKRRVAVRQSSSSRHASLPVLCTRARATQCGCEYSSDEGGGKAFCFLFFSLSSEFGGPWFSSEEACDRSPLFCLRPGFLFLLLSPSRILTL